MTTSSSYCVGTLCALMLALCATSASAQTTQHQPNYRVKTTKTAKLYAEGRLSVAIPSESSGNVVVSGVGLGRFFSGDQFSLGLRMIWIPNPPENPLGEDRAYELKTDSALGPVIDWRMFIGSPQKLRFYTNVSAGFVYGVPNKETQEAAEAANEEVNNIIIPVVELGLGVRLMHRIDPVTHVYISPEFGFIPVTGAPYMAISAGLGF